MEKFYTPEEVAEMLGVHHYTLLKLIRKGIIPALQVGTGSQAHYRIPASALDRMVAEALRTAEELRRANEGGGES